MLTNEPLPRPHGRTLALERRADGFRLTIDCRVPFGPVTVLGFARDGDGGPKLLLAEGWALPSDPVKPDPTRTWLRFPTAPELLYARWAAEGPTYEVVVGAGHVAGDVCATARRLRMPCRWLR